MRARNGHSLPQLRCDVSGAGRADRRRERAALRGLRAHLGAGPAQADPAGDPGPAARRGASSAASAASAASASSASFASCAGLAAFSARSGAAPRRSSACAASPAAAGDHRHADPDPGRAAPSGAAPPAGGGAPPGRPVARGPLRRLGDQHRAGDRCRAGPRALPRGNLGGLAALRPARGLRAFGVVACSVGGFAIRCRPGRANPRAAGTPGTALNRPSETPGLETRWPRNLPKRDVNGLRPPSRVRESAAPGLPHAARRPRCARTTHANPSRPAPGHRAGPPAAGDR